MIKKILLAAICVLTSTAVKAQSPTMDYLKQVKEKITAPFVTEEKLDVGKMLNFAKDLIGTPYKYASSSPSRGFDCSGFVGYVFKNFGYQVPRSSREYARAGKTVTLDDAKPGDVILFTGTNSKNRTIGHVGIIASKEGDDVKFIHSSSGHKKGVTITDLNDGYYRRRLVKIVALEKE